MTNIKYVYKAWNVGELIFNNMKIILEAYTLND
jgi:hypothetical protein